jgi:hypothetical protein
MKFCFHGEKTLPPTPAPLPVDGVAVSVACPDADIVAAVAGIPNACRILLRHNFAPSLASGDMRVKLRKP